MTESPDETYVYLAKSPAGIKPLLCLLGTIAGFGLGVILFVVMLFVPDEGQFERLGLIIPPFLVGIACASYGVVLIGSPQQVEVSSGGIVIETLFRKRMIPWSDVDRIEFDKSTVLMTAQSYRRLVFLNQRGRRLGAISELIDDFDDLVTRVKTEVGKRSDQQPTSGPMRRSKRNGIMFITAGIACFVAYPWLILHQIETRKHWQELQSSGVSVDATIERLYLYNNFAPRVEYSFEDENGKRHTRDTLLLRHAWNRLSAPGTVPIRYLPDDPEFNRIMEGEESAKSEMGTQNIFVGILGVIVLGGAFTGGGILQLMGIDIIFDDKKRRFRIKRLDEFAPASDGSKT